MPKFKVKVKETEIYIIDVVADDEEGAMEKAEVILDCTALEKVDYHNDSESSIKVIE